jgi:RimJ/RimL family protein N-acetyltransferase
MKHAADELLTDRLRLQRLEATDAGLMLAIWNDPDFIRFVGDRGVRTEQEALKALQDGALKQWSDLGYGAYRVARRGETKPLGICGLFKRENLDDPDIGYGFLPDHCGRGYAFEAACAVRDHARDTMELRRICAIVSGDNARSIHLLEKLGMTESGKIRMPDEDDDLLLFEIEFR